MKKMFTLRDEDIFKDQSEIVSFPKHYETRSKVRIIGMDSCNKLPYMYVQSQNASMFPGGSVDEGEDLQTAAIREMKEETGCDIEIVREIGYVDEFRSQMARFQQTYYYEACIIAKGVPHFTDFEISLGCELRWSSVFEFQEILKYSTKETNAYQGRFNSARDLRVIKEFLT